MQKTFIVAITFFFPFYACTKSVPRAKGTFPLRPLTGMWNSLSPDTEMLVLVEPGRIPSPVRDLLPVPRHLGSCENRPVRSIWILHGGHQRGEPFTATVFQHGESPGQGICNPVGVGRFRQWPILSDDRNFQVIWTPGATVEAPRVQAQFLADRLASADRVGTGKWVQVAPEELVRAVGPWRSESQPDPVFSLWFAGSDRVKAFLKPLFADPPLRGEMLVFVAENWVQLRIRLDFSSTSVAEQAVERLRDGIVQMIHSGNFPGMNWRSALEPLVVHPEGSQLYVQWSMPVVHALPLFIAGREGVRHVDGNP